MPNNTLDEREFELINIIGAEMAFSQRDLSQKINLSLGATNMLIRRLISKGYIRLRQLDNRKVSYILTPKGFMEKTRKAVKYTLKTINSLGLIKGGIKDIVSKLYDNGIRSFIVVGKSDFATVIEIVFKELNLNDYHIEYVDVVPVKKVEGIVLICKEDVTEADYGFDNAVNLVQELARDIYVINHLTG
ncbi:MAG: winged helix-turn-helix transcriptional regulator [Candidatus Omnitrophica bacterium]|nr:winged helix-turn-helix transcriptional regulator [Candidatus Omnitrophota bacterium]